MSNRRIALLMGLVATSLAAMSILHLSGVLPQGVDPAAGTAEGIICVVLVVGTSALVRDGNRRAAGGALVFAVAGFLVGLGHTIPAGRPLDIAYHAAALPLLALALVGLPRMRAPYP
jgi:hypothetical protein